MVGGEEAVSAVKRLAYNPIPPLRARAFRVLAKIGEGDQSLLPLYLEALEDGEVEVRRAAVRGLGSIHDERSVNTLIAILQWKGPQGTKEDYRVEEAACLALTRLGSERGAAVMLDLIKKKFLTMQVKRRVVHPVVKGACCYGLSQLGGTESVAAVRALVARTGPEGAQRSRQACGLSPARHHKLNPGQPQIHFFQICQAASTKLNPGQAPS